MEKPFNPYQPPDELEPLAAVPAFTPEPEENLDFDARAPFWGIVWGLTKIGCLVGLIVIVYGGRALWIYLHG